MPATPEEALRRRRAPRGTGEQLREDILDATTALLLETANAKTVSIRSVADRVGVTPPSIYLHFTDKDTLLDAVGARYFAKLDEQMQQAAKGQPSAVAVLRAQGLAYVRFAVANPQLYRIATMGEGIPGSEVDSSLASAAFQHMLDSVQALVDEGRYDAADPVGLALQLWSAVHGVAALLIAKPYLPWGDVDRFAEHAMRAACVGHMVVSIVGVDASPQDFLDWFDDLVDGA